MQVWPVAAKIPATTPLAAASRSASAKTMFGDLPPSSSVTRARCVGGAVHHGACRSPSRRERDLVDARVLDQRRARLGAEPGDDVEHAGREAGLLDQRANSSVEAGACSAGLTTNVQPAASAGASFQLISSTGEFHGVIAATTPTGSRSV